MGRWSMVDITVWLWKIYTVYHRLKLLLGYWWLWSRTWYHIWCSSSPELFNSPKSEDKPPYRISKTTNTDLWRCNYKDAIKSPNIVRLVHSKETCNAMPPIMMFSPSLSFVLLPMMEVHKFCKAEQRIVFTVTILTKPSLPGCIWTTSSKI